MGSTLRSRIIRTSMTGLSRLRERWGQGDKIVDYTREEYKAHGETIAVVPRTQSARSPINIRVYGHDVGEPGSREEHENTIRENLRRS